MGLCKYCGKSGFFLRVNRDGLCQACLPGIVLEVNQRARVISESFKLINNSKKATASQAQQLRRLRRLPSGSGFRSVLGLLLQPQ
jgi:hypothetical protein